MQTVIEDEEFYYVYSDDLNDQINIDLFEEENPIYFECKRMNLELVCYYIEHHKATMKQTSNYIYHDKFTDEVGYITVDNSKRCYWVY